MVTCCVSRHYNLYLLFYFVMPGSQLYVQWWWNSLIESPIPRSIGKKCILLFAHVYVIVIRSKVVTGVSSWLAPILQNMIITLHLNSHMMAIWIHAVNKRLPQQARLVIFSLNMLLQCQCNIDCWVQNFDSSQILFSGRLMRIKKLLISCYMYVLVLFGCEYKSVLFLLCNNNAKIGCR